jgi:hypothetical protein
MLEPDHRGEGETIDSPFAQGGGRYAPLPWAIEIRPLQGQEPLPTTHSGAPARKIAAVKKFNFDCLLGKEGTRGWSSVPLYGPPESPLTKGDTCEV